MGDVTGLGLLAAQEDMLAMVHMLQENVQGLNSFSALPVEQGWECIDGENPVGAL